MAQPETDDRVKRIILRQLETKLINDIEEITYKELLEKAEQKYDADANIICGKIMVHFFKPHDILRSGRKYAFPNGYIDMSYRGEPGERLPLLYFWTEIVLNYSKEKYHRLNKILSELDNFPELNWREIEFELSVRFDADVLVGICEESKGELEVESYKPGLNDTVYVRIREWGFAEFKNSETGASVRIYPLNCGECLKRDFFEKINPNTLFRHFGKSFKGKRKGSEEIRDFESELYLSSRVKKLIPKKLLPTIELIQKCLEHDLHQCCPPFIRKTLENALSIRFKEDGKEHMILDTQGRKVTLPRLIELAVQEKYLSQKVSKQLLQTKTFGDIAVHDVEIQIDRTDVVHDLRNLRLALEQMYPEKRKKTR